MTLPPLHTTLSKEKKIKSKENPTRNTQLKNKGKCLETKVNFKSATTMRATTTTFTFVFIRASCFFYKFMPPTSFLFGIFNSQVQRCTVGRFLCKSNDKK